MAQTINTTYTTAETLYDAGYRTDGVWQEQEVSCTASGCNVPKTGKPFTATPGHKREGDRYGKARTVKAGERDGKPMYKPALWISIQTPLREDGALNVVCQFHSAKALRTARQSRVDELMSVYDDELEGSNQKERESSAWRRAAQEIQLFVPLFYVLNRLDQLVRAEDDEVEALVLGSEGDEVTCAICTMSLPLGAALALERMREDRAEWFALVNLVEGAMKRSDIASDPVRSALCATLMDIANPPREERRGVKPVHVCRGCSASILDALNFGRRTMTFVDGGDEREQTIFVRATTVVRRVKSAELRWREGQKVNLNRSAASWAKLGEVMGSTIVSSDDVGSDPSESEKIHLSERQSQGRGKRRGKGRGRSEPQEA